MTPEKEIFTTEEAAQMMGCAPSTIEEHGQLFLYRSIGCITATNCATRPCEYAGDSHTAAHIRQPS